MDMEMAGLAGERGKQVRRIDFPERELLVLAEGDWRGYRSAACAKEPETAAWLREVVHEGDVLYDIGSCVGSYALIAAALGAEVHAFEPAAANFWQLQQNLWLNGLAGLRAWPVALTGHTGPLEFELSSPGPGRASHSVKAGASYPLSGSEKLTHSPSLASLWTTSPRCSGCPRLRT